MINGNASQNQTGRTFHQYTTFASDIDLTDGAHGPDGLPARCLLISDVGAGALVVDTDTEQNKTLDITNLQGEYIVCAVRTIRSATTAGTVVAFW